MSRQARQKAAARWRSGGSGDGVDTYTMASAPFGEWRGRQLDSKSSWVDVSYVSQEQVWSLNPGSSSYVWDGDIDIAVGAIFGADTWAMAAAGDAAIVQHWTTCLTNLHDKFNRILRGTCYVRFAHEWNGNWYDWSVGNAEIADFITAWRRFYTLKQSIFPAAKLVFCLNANTVGHNYNWTTAWPGDAYVDVYGVDFYANHWSDNLTYDGYEAPSGLEQHRLFAQQHGKPLAVSEWAVGSTKGGDLPDYVEYMYNFFSTHGGIGAGQLLYENYFNISKPSGNMKIYPVVDSACPNSAALYQGLF